MWHMGQGELLLELPKYSNLAVWCKVLWNLVIRLVSSGPEGSPHGVRRAPALRPGRGCRL